MRRGVYLLAFSVLLFIIYSLSLFSIHCFSNHQLSMARIFQQTQELLESKAANMVLGENTNLSYTDARVKALSQFLASYQSPLTPYAEKIVLISDKYGFDYGLLPAIAMVESGLCRQIPVDSHNCWGWGIYGKTVTRFVSYDEAIDKVAKGIKQEYIDKGFVTPEQIMTKYNPSNHNNWLGKVNFFLEVLE